MAESNKKKRKKSAKTRQTETQPTKAATTTTSSQSPEQIEAVESVEAVKATETTEVVESTEVTQLDDQDYIEQEEAPESPDPVNASENVYDNIITHRTSSTPTSTQFSSKLKAGLAAARTPRPWLWLGTILIVLTFGLTMWWQWQRSYVGVVNGQYIPTATLVDFALSSSGSDALTQLTQQYLIEQEGYRQNIHISDEVIQAELQKVVDDSGGEESYHNALLQYGIPEQHLVNQIRTKQTLVELTKDKVSVTDKEVEDYYNANKETLDPDGSRGFDNIKDLIRIQLTEQKQEAEFSSYVQNLTEKSKVSTNLDHTNLTFMDFLNKEVFSIPSDVAKLFNFSK